MSALSACQDAIARLVARRPASVFASDDEICVEIASLANEAATDIAKAHDWQALTALKIVNGDGVTEAWPMPADYDRMAAGTAIHSGTWTYMRYANAGSLDAWQDLSTLQPGLPPGYWAILQNQISFLPKVATGQDARFYYISSYWARSAGDAPKAAFDRDDDKFALDERLLTLSLIWRWKAMKAMAYDEDLRNFDIALSQAMARDKGARTIRKGGSSLAGLNAHTAWPWPLGGA